MKNENIPSSPKDVKSNGTKELRIYKREQNIEKKVSVFRFFEDHNLCFKQNGGDWTNEDYNKGLETCKRVTERAFNGEKGHIIVRGSMVPTLLSELGIQIQKPTILVIKEDKDIEILKNGGRVVL